MNDETPPSGTGGWRYASVLIYRSDEHESGYPGAETVPVWVADFPSIGRRLVDFGEILDFFGLDDWELVAMNVESRVGTQAQCYRATFKRRAPSLSDLKSQADRSAGLDTLP